MGVGLSVRLRTRVSGQGDLLSELQSTAGVNNSDRVQGGRAED